MNSTTLSTRLRQLQTLPTQWVRGYNTRKPKKASTGFVGPEGHGEKIWVWAHRRTEATIYTLRDRLDGFHDLKQVTFTGKKTKPAKLRKDYWSPIAIINFPANHGSVGRSVFQKLRELKHRHEVDWPEDFRYKTPDEYTEKEREIEEERAAKKADETEGEEVKEFMPMRTVRERMKALQRQKANSIADMAALLAGEGKGNRMNTEEGGLLPVTVQWARQWDTNYAQAWSENVAHAEMPKKGVVQEVEVPAFEEAVEAEEGEEVIKDLDKATEAKPIKATMT